MKGVINFDKLFEIYKNEKMEWDEELFKKAYFVDF